MENNTASLESLQLEKYKWLYETVSDFLKKNRGDVSKLKITNISSDEIKIEISLPVLITKEVIERTEAGGTASASIAEFKRLLALDSDLASFDGEITKKYIKRKDNKKDSLILLSSGRGEIVVAFPDHSYSTDCAGCNRTGRITCTSCGGACTTTCSRCYGSGRHTCNSCYGSGIITKQETVHDYSGSNIPSRTVTVQATCDSCHGLGRVNCSSCSGSGVATCNTCRGSGRISHSACSGYGYFTHHGRFVVNSSVKGFRMGFIGAQFSQELKNAFKTPNGDFLVKNCDLSYDGCITDSKNNTVIYNYSFLIKAIEYIVEYNGLKTREVFFDKTIGWSYQLNCLDQVLDKIMNNEYIDNKNKQDHLYKELMEYGFIKDFYRQTLESIHNKNEDSTESFLEKNNIGILVSSKHLSRLRGVIDYNIKHMAPSSNMRAIVTGFIPISLIVLYFELLFLFGDSYLIKSRSAFTTITSGAYITQLTEMSFIAIFIMLLSFPVTLLFHDSSVKKKNKLPKDMASIVKTDHIKLIKTLFVSTIIEVYIIGIASYLLKYFTGNKIFQINNENTMVLLHKIHVHIFGMNNWLINGFDVIHQSIPATLTFLMITLTIPSLMNYLIEGYNKKIWLLLFASILSVIFVPLAFPVLILASILGSLYIKFYT